MTHGSLFSGIGGFDLAAEWMGWENKFHCEWNEFGQRILKYYWPNAESFNDITKSDFTKYATTIDVLTGGFPCQPYSTAGKRKGKEDNRHLWPEMLRVIKEVRPRWVVGENVHGIVNWSKGLVFNEIRNDLEIEGYETWAYVLPALSVNADHRRDRIWFIAHACGTGLQTSDSQFRQINGIFKKTPIEFTGSSSAQWSVRKRSTGMLRRSDGVSQKLDGITFSKWKRESIKGFGNAIVPQVALQIFKAIEQYELINL